MPDLVLVSDAGGTNTRFALTEARSELVYHIRQLRKAARETK